MVFTDPLAFPCDICQGRRQEQFLSTNSKKVTKSDGSQAEVSLRYCNDRDPCIQLAAQRVKELAEDARRA